MAESTATADINNRFIQTIEYLEGMNAVRTRGELAKTFGISQQKLTEILKGRMNVPLEVLQILFKTYNASYNYIFNGAAPILNSEVAENSIVNDADIAYKTAFDDLIKLPVMDLQFAAGASSITPAYLEQLDTIYIPRTWVKRGNTFACGRVRGHSMAPTMQDSGYVILRLLERQEWAAMPNEEVYVVVSKDGTHANAQLKRVKNRFSRGFIVMMSDNPDKSSYGNFNLEQDEIISIWHVDWYFTNRMPNIHNQYYSRLQDLENKVDDLLHDLKPIIKK